MAKFKIYTVRNKIDDETKGSKPKFWATLNLRNALIKINLYKDKNEQDLRSWNVSEKLYSEFSKYLKFSCVETDLIITEEGKYGIASYDYKKKDMNILSGDNLFISVFQRLPQKKISKNNNEAKILPEDYNYDNIANILLYYSPNGLLLREFNKIIIMDALTGEADRHYENWGICHIKNEYHLLPSFDNSCCLLHVFRDEKAIESKLKNKTIEDYSLSSPCKISIKGLSCTHFEFIDYLIENLPNEIKEEFIKDIRKLKKINNKYIKDTVNKIPEELCSRKHKDLVIEYVICRRDILLSKVEEL